MSRIGKLPIRIPDKVKVTPSGNEITVKGPLGELKREIYQRVKVRVDDGNIMVARLGNDKKSGAFHGLYQRLISNMVKGVTEGYKKELEIVGIGYKAQMQGKNLQLQLGFSHTVLFEPPEGIEISLPNPTSIVVRGIDKQLVGEVAAKIRRYKPPEPYKGKGIRYVGEYVRRKAGKTIAK